MNFDFSQKEKAMATPQIFDPMLNETFLLYLSAEDLANLQMTCKALNVGLNSPKFDSFWQPLLNQLHSIDPSISVMPKHQSILNAFVAGAKKVKTRIFSEISFLRKNHGDAIFDNHPHIKKLIEAFNNRKLLDIFYSYMNGGNEFERFAAALKFPLNMNDFVAINAELEEINIAIIKAASAYLHWVDFLGNRHILSNIFVLNNSITRLPKAVFESVEDQRAWRGLDYLDLSDNLLNELPNYFSNLTHLQTLMLKNNQFTSLPEFLNELLLKRLYVSNNQILALNESIGNGPLSYLDVSNNQLTTLPKTIANRDYLLVYCDGNNIMSVPDEWLDRGESWVYQTLGKSAYYYIPNSGVSVDFFNMISGQDDDHVSANSQGSVAAMDMSNIVESGIKLLSHFRLKDKPLVENVENKALEANVIKKQKMTKKPTRKNQRRRLA